MKTATSNTVATETIGRRIYITGNTFPLKEALKSAGCQWDSERRQWWIGAGKQAEIDAIISAPPPKEDLSTKRLYGKAQYKGREYYMLGESQTGKYRLTVLDGSIDFWADKAQCTVTKTYQARERRWRGKVVGTDYTTLASIRRFIAQQKNPATAREQCNECGSWKNAGEDCRDCGGC